MLTDWERRQLAEIERGLEQDFTLRSRARRLIGSIRPWAVTSALLSLGCLVVLIAVGAWSTALALAVVFAVLGFGGRVKRRGRARTRGLRRR